MKNLPFEVCFNRHSIYDGTHEEAIQMFMSSLKGLVSVYNEYHIDCETAFIYYDCEKPFSDCNICLDFSLGDIISKIEDLNPDLIDFFMNISTQAPFEKKIQSNFYESIACTGFVAECIGGEDAKIFHFALLTDAYILSMPCKPWHRAFIKCHGYCNGKRITSDEPFYIKNICCESPDFLYEEPSAHKCTIYQNCKLHVCYKDHPPPHVHVLHKDWRALVKLDGSGKYLAGNISANMESSILEYIQNNIIELRKSWDIFNPIVHKKKQ